MAARARRAGHYRRKFGDGETAVTVPIETSEAPGIHFRYFRARNSTIGVAIEPPKTLLQLQPDVVLYQRFELHLAHPGVAVHVRALEQQSEALVRGAGRLTPVVIFGPPVIRGTVAFGSKTHCSAAL